MLAADPQIAGTADWIGRRLGSFIGVTIQLGLGDKQPVEFVLIEAGQREIEAGGLQVAKFEPQQFLVPVTRIRQLVVADCVSLALRFGPAPRDDGRDLSNAFELRRLETPWPAINMPFSRTSTGMVQPNSRSDALIRSICSGP